MKLALLNILLFCAAPVLCAADPPMKFGALLDFVSYESPFRPPLNQSPHISVKRVARLMNYDPPERLMLKNLEGLNQTGVEIIRLDLYFDPWLLENSSDPKLKAWAKDRRQAFDAVVRRIRKDGKKLFIADAAAGYYANFQLRSHSLPWKKFREAQKRQIETLTRRYKPDYYEVVKEYRWYSDWGTISEVPTADDWTEQTRELCRIVKKIHPGAKTAVGVIARSKLDADVVERVVNIPELDIIGIDIYGLPDLEVLKKNEFAPFVEQHGKEAWLAETWTGLLGSYGEPKREETDALWLKTLVDIARQQHMRGFIPFFTSHFFFYDMPPGWETVSEEKAPELFTGFLDEQLNHRTAAFRAYQQCIQESKQSK